MNFFGGSIFLGFCFRVRRAYRWVGSRRLEVRVLGKVGRRFLVRGLVLVSGFLVNEVGVEKGVSGDLG